MRRDDRGMWRDVCIANFDPIVRRLSAATSQQIRMEAHCLLNYPVEVREFSQLLMVGYAYASQFLTDRLDVLRMH